MMGLATLGDCLAGRGPRDLTLREDEREDIGDEEMVALESDEQYIRLAEARWVMQNVERDVIGDPGLPAEVRKGADAGEIEDAVDAYVDHWLTQHRADDQEAAADPSPRWVESR